MEACERRVGRRAPAARATLPLPALWHRAVASLVALVLVVAASACGLSGNQKRTLGGAAVGAGTGALIGGATGGDPGMGAAIGGAVGAVGGSLIGDDDDDDDDRGYDRDYEDGYEDGYRRGRSSR